MTLDLRMSLEHAMVREASAMASSLRNDVVLPWVDETATNILAARVLSAGPTRGGEHVQVRFRTGKRLVSSCHILDFLRNKDTSYRPKSSICAVTRDSIISSLVRTEEVENRFRWDLRERLDSLVDSISFLSSIKKSIPSEYPSLALRIVQSHIAPLEARQRVLNYPGVGPKIDSLIESAADAIAGIPYHAFPERKRRLDHGLAKRALLKAMKAALIAGVTDEEIAEIKNEALVFQIMS